MSSKTPTSPKDLQKMNAALREQLQNKSEALNKAKKDYLDMRKTYQELLSKLNTTDSSTNQENDVSSPSDNEEKQWEYTWKQAIDLMDPVLNIPFKEKESIDSSEQRSILIKYITILVNQKQSCESNESYIRLKQKYIKNKQHLLKLRDQCRTLLEEVHRNREILETHLQDVKEFSLQDKTQLQKWIKEIRKIMERQLDVQSRIIKESKDYQKTVSQTNGRKYQSTYQPNHHRHHRKHSPKKVIEKFNDSEDEMPKVHYHHPRRAESPVEHHPPSPKIIEKKTHHNHIHSDNNNNKSYEAMSHHLNSIRTNLNKLSSSQAPKIKQPPPKENFESFSDYNDGYDSSSTFDEEEATQILDNMLNERTTEMKKFRQTYHEHVNQLVGLTNDIRKDYRKYAPKDAPQISLENLSKLHDSLVSIEHQLDHQ